MSGGEAEWGEWGSGGRGSRIGWCGRIRRDATTVETVVAATAIRPHQLDPIFQLLHFWCDVVPNWLREGDEGKVG